MTEAGTAQNAAHKGDDSVSVLLIEDDTDVRDMYRMRLVRDGYEVTTAADGEEGVRMALEQHPDIVFLDLRLPKMDGFQVLQVLRSDNATKDTPVIILTNYGEPELKQRGLVLGASDYVLKSATTPGELSGNIESWLEDSPEYDESLGAR
jgi:DNA-binding response OmpR family regulator